MIFSVKILSWYAENGRDLPWRQTRDPYKIWLSEVMLQQTRVAQGLPYYERFLQAFPTVEDLSEAGEEEVLKLWQGLGYYSRARNLHATAQTVAKEFDGVFPDTYEGLRNLRGVGDYTASAIASISYDLPEPVVDGNVYRVLARYFNVDIIVNSFQGMKYFKKLAHEVMDKHRPRDYNQAIMDFGALQCVPKNPDCAACPLSNSCAALQAGKVDQLPRKLSKAKVRTRHFNYLVVIDPEWKTLLKQRTEEGIWKKLYEFPLVESPRKLGLAGMKKKLPELLPGKKIKKVRLVNSKPIVHKLSHQHLHTRFWMARSPEMLEEGIPVTELEEFPVPVLIADFIQTLKNSYF